ncbi:MAG: WbqC family protein [Alphaproteobacteria bacterium]|nr:WbqC family protein [Alphaproteobacteria bacterium]
MKVAVGIHQPNYLPWLGYFRKIALCDRFVFFDNALLPLGKSFVSRNAIPTLQGPLWLTVPVAKKQILLAEVPIVDQRWRRKHIQTLRMVYSKAPFKDVLDSVVIPVLEEKQKQIADLNITLIEALSHWIGLSQVEFVRASSLGISETGADSIEPILKMLDATHYVTGSGAGTQHSIDVESLKKLGIETHFISSKFAEYSQMQMPFMVNMSAIDACACIGPSAVRELLLNASEQ